MGGSDTVNAVGIYGTLGVASASNVPGARGDAVSWKDASGNLWLFGGYGYDSTGTSGALNDLWEYSPSAKTWTWIGGSDAVNEAGIYGTLGVASTNNVPGARGDAASWTDTSGNLWLFGGYGYDSTTGGDGILNDLWEYSPSAKTWTWMGGSDAVNAVAVYGTQGVASASNVPGAREYAVSWTDSSGNLWLFGGMGSVSADSSGALNDLWEYSPSAKTWTWMGGSNAVNAAGVYGAQGVTTASNVPGARYSAISWVDASGNLWLFGGYGYDSTRASGFLNDLWEYSPSAKTWTWMSGSDTVFAAGVYGTLGVASASNVPGARQYAVSWTDSSGNLWLFGGDGSDSTGTNGYLNDLWEYSPSAMIWTWVSGSDTVNAAGVYGALGVASASNVPGARGYAVSWTDANGNLWLFGGYGSDSTGVSSYLNDLWRCEP